MAVWFSQLLLLATVHAGPPPAEAACPDGLDPRVWAHATRLLGCARATDATLRPDRIAVIDFSLPSSAPRLWVVDLAQGDVLLHTRVAHGRTSGERLAGSFSNEPGSHASSLGLYRGAEVYRGRHGRSLRLDGLEPGFNDRARERAIVVHGAEYATEAFVDDHGRLGRSWGCPAVAPEVSDPLIDLLADGTALVAWYPDPDWLVSSASVHCERAGSR